MKRYDTLDALAQDYPSGTTVRFQAGPETRFGTVMGVVFSLPLASGGRKEPALIVRDRLGFGHVYPHELVEEALREYDRECDASHTTEGCNRPSDL